VSAVSGSGLLSLGTGRRRGGIEAARDLWRAANAPHLVALVRAGAIFRDGVLIERPEILWPLPARLHIFARARSSCTAKGSWNP